jgi:hypothetical protein
MMILSMGGSNAEMAIHWLYPTTLSLGEAGKIWEVARKLPGSPFSIFSQLLPTGLVDNNFFVATSAGGPRTDQHHTTSCFV